MYDLRATTILMLQCIQCHQCSTHTLALLSACKQHGNGWFVRDADFVCKDDSLKGDVQAKHIVQGYHAPCCILFLAFLKPPFFFLCTCSTCALTLLHCWTTLKQYNVEQPCKHLTHPELEHVTPTHIMVFIEIQYKLHCQLKLWLLNACSLPTRCLLSR